MLRSTRLLPLASQFQAAQRWSRELNQGFGASGRAAQLERLRAVWEDCINDVPYYRGLVACGRAPRRIDSWNAFRQIPVLDRATLKDNLVKFRRLSGPPDYYSSTAGSTAQPVQLGEWRKGLEPLRIAKLVAWVRSGYSLEDRIMLIWGHAHLLGSGWRRHYRRAVRKAKDWVAGYRRIDAYTLNPEKAARIAREISRLRPAGLIGYAAVLDLFVRYTGEYHEQMREAGLKFVMPCAEAPPRSDSLDLLHSVFGCPIVQEFGGVDFGHVGFKVDEAPYILFPELNILEAESDPKEPDGGPALVTTLYRRYVPLIRYRQGDMISEVVRDEHGLVVSFGEQQGRVNDMITLADGSSVHSVGLVHCFKEEPSVFNVQLVLTNQGPRFSLVVDNALFGRKEHSIRERLRQIHPEFADAPFDLVTDLESNRAGKRRWVVNHCVDVLP